MLLRMGQACRTNPFAYAITHSTIPQFIPIRHLSRSATPCAAAGYGKTVTKPSATPKKQLERLSELRERTAAENSMTGKAAIIAQYPDLRELLEYVYQPDLRFHITSASVKRFLPDTHFTKKAMRGDPSRQQTLTTLFDSLSRRSVTGADAKARIATFLFQHGIIKDGDHDGPAFDTFCRLLDRNLRSGFSATILEKVPWEEERRPRGSPRSSAPDTSSTDTVALSKFSCALSKPISPPFDELFKGQDPQADNEGSKRWYASRKLDGVRCITYIDLFVPDGRSKQLSILDVKFLSRSGKEFESLSRLEEQIRQLLAFPQLHDLLSRDPVSVAHRVTGEVKRLVLDGEVCVMKKVAAASDATPQDDDGTGSLWESDGMVEDFPATVSQIRRKKPIEHPRYYLFDVLSWAEFSTKAAYPAPKLGLDFRTRIRDIKNLAAFFESSNQVPMVHALAQLRVTTLADVNAAVKRAWREGWEGLMFRANTPYIGKRSSDMYKFKEWQDAEYTVVGRDTARMRLAVDGVFGDHEACSNVWIEHNGHRVKVGSGFTAEQRIRYARDPEAIVGKQITVQYFGESEASGRPEGVKSLRFPRVKKVWEGKGRDI